MKFGIPMIWRKPISHLIDCYFCLSKYNSFGKQGRWVYANVQTITFPVPHSDKLPIPKSPETNSDSSNNNIVSSGSDFDMSGCTKQHILTQDELSDWIRDLELTKEKALIHASRMKQFNFLHPSVKITYYKNRDIAYSRFFNTIDKICFCADIPGLFNKLKYPYDPKEWRLFIDSSK